MRVSDVTIQKLLLKAGKIKEEDLTKLAEQVEAEKKPLQDIVIKNNIVSDKELTHLYADFIDIPFAEINAKDLDKEVLKLIPERIARKYKAVIIGQNDDGRYILAMEDPDDIQAVDFLQKQLGKELYVTIATNQDILSALDVYRGNIGSEITKIVTEQDETEEDEEEVDEEELTEDSPIAQTVNLILEYAIKSGASDIHIEPMEEQGLVRYRIDGLLHDAMVLPKKAGPSVSARIKVLANLKLDEKRLPQDGRFKVDMNNEKVSFRVSILPTYYGEKIVMRLLRESISGFTLEYLNFHGEGLESIHQVLKKTTGMILMTGPTGSGKTTTLYTMLDILNTPDVNISTIEDPIEYQMARINQTQVKPEIGFSFPQGIRTLVRQDPDIIMVGEIRDNETAALAVNASLTGHLVLSTLHTNSAAGAIPRLLDMKVEPFLLVSTLDVVIGQRLVRRLSDLKQQYKLTKDEFAQLEKIVDLKRVLNVLREEKIVKSTDDWDSIKFWKAVPGPEDDGFKSRVGIHEVLTMSPTIKNLIMKNATSSEIEEQAKKEGMLTMLEDGIFKCVQGLTTIEEVLRVITD